ncbi:MAG: hypothetical protein ACXAC5_03025 [Promethearchaeota archaeon]|jgi:hypothetical protein
MKLNYLLPDKSIADCITQFAAKHDYECEGKVVIMLSRDALYWVEITVPMTASFNANHVIRLNETLKEIGSDVVLRVWKENAPKFHIERDTPDEAIRRIEAQSSKLEPNIKYRWIGNKWLSE